MNSLGGNVHQYLRIVFTIVHIFLVSFGIVNLVVIALIVIKPYMRSITNVYMLNYCSANFLYLINLTFVVVAQINGRSWEIGSAMCTFHHGTESTAKYASIILVVLLAADRYCVVCCSRQRTLYRNYAFAIFASLVAWLLAFCNAVPLYIYSDVVHIDEYGRPPQCIVRWPSSAAARRYIAFSTASLFLLPLFFIVFFYYHILKKVREAGECKVRMRMGLKSQIAYHRVNRLVLWIVFLHVLCWSPFWLFNIFVATVKPQIRSNIARIIANVIHIFPYINCAVNPILYAILGRSFRRAFRSVIFECNCKNE